MLSLACAATVVRLADWDLHHEARCPEGDDPPDYVHLHGWGQDVQHLAQYQDIWPGHSGLGVLEYPPPLVWCNPPALLRCINTYHLMCVVLEEIHIPEATTSVVHHCIHLANLLHGPAQPP